MAACPAVRRGPTVWPWLAALTLVVVGVAALGWLRAWHRLRRSELAASRLPILAVVLLVVQAADITALWNAALPFAGPDVVDRVLLVVTYGVALGLLVVGVRLARTGRTARPVADSSGT